MTKENEKTKAKEVKNTDNKIKKSEAKPVWNSERKTRKRKRLLKKQKRKTSFRKVVPGKKEKLTKHGRRTKWAPVWVILKKFGPGKRIHPSAITRYKRSWRRGKLHIKPRKIRPRHYG